MNINECLTHFIGNLNQDYLDSLSDLTDEQLHFLPNDRSCHIAFHAWHFIRTEDNIINFVCQGRKPSVWARQGLAERWGLPAVAQGTGMPLAEARVLRLPGLAPFLQYARDVRADITPYLANASAADMESIVKVVPYGERPKLQQIVQTVLAHGNRHLGQILVLRAMQGLGSETS